MKRILFSVMCMCMNAYAYQLPHSKQIIYQLMGEWTVWQSTFPKYDGKNKISVFLSFPSEISIVQQNSIGPLVIQKTRSGHYLLENESCLVEYPIEQHKSSFSPICSTPITITFKDKTYSIISCFGIGCNEVPILWREYQISITQMDLHVVDREDMFLQNVDYQNDENKINFCHLIRQTRAFEPVINVPLSTFLATHFIGMILSQLIEIKFHK